jgi:hypothetical protein
MSDTCVEVYMADAPMSGERFIPEPPLPDDHAKTAALAKAPVSGIWFRPNLSGCGVVDPAIASDLDMSFDPPDWPHPIRDELGIPLNRYLFS